MEAHHPIQARTMCRPNGFTLIELLVIVSFIAILVSIAIPRFPRVKELAVNTAVKSDLLNAMKAEEVFYSDNGAYKAFAVTDGGSAVEPEFAASAGVSVTATLVDEGVRIVGSHPASSSMWCISTASPKIVQGSNC